jgi:hypothetical protein
MVKPYSFQYKHRSTNWKTKHGSKIPMMLLPYPSALQGGNLSLRIIKNVSVFEVINTELLLSFKRGKTIPLEVWTSPDDSRSVRLPDFKTIGT